MKKQARNRANATCKNSLSACVILNDKTSSAIDVRPFGMKRSLLARLRTNGAFYLIGAILLILFVPLYQAIALEPAGFSSVLNATGGNTISGQAQGIAPMYLVWIHGHSGLFLGYRILLILAFAILLTLPFSLYRIIVAQEILGQQEDTAIDLTKKETQEETQNQKEPVTTTDDGMPAFAWRGKGFAVLAAWLGTAGLLLYVLGTIASTSYLIISSAHATSGTEVSDSVIWWSGTFTIITNTFGIGLLGLGMLFFGAMISRTGMNLWPSIWVALGYVAILVGGLLCIGAIAAATAGGGSQGILNTVATFLFALWTFWLGLILIRLQPE
jgi:hypothetical protein